MTQTPVRRPAARSGNLFYYYRSCSGDFTSSLVRGENEKNHGTQNDPPNPIFNRPRRAGRLKHADRRATAGGRTARFKFRIFMTAGDHS